MNKADIEKIVKGSLAALFLQLAPTELLEDEIARRKAPAALVTLFSPSEVILSECNLGTGIKNVLRANDIVTLQDLLKVKKKVFKGFRNVGDKTIRELKAVCINCGVEWK